MIRNLAEMTWLEVQKLNLDEALVFLPVSPLEQHGPHLPIGMDLFGAEFLTRKMAELFQSLHPTWEVLLVPGLPIGSNAFDYPGSLFTRQRVIRDLLVDYGACLARHGLIHQVMISVHGGTGHIVAMEEAADILARRFKCRIIAPFGALASKYFHGGYDEQLGALTGTPLTAEEQKQLRSDWHAGWWETSLMLAACPHLVRPEYRELQEVRVDDFRKVNDQLVKSLNEGLGYLGAPAKASAEFGELLSGLLAVDGVRLIDRIVVGGGAVQPKDRSPLYDIPFMRTDFVRNSVAMGAGVLLTLLGGLPLLDAVRRGTIPFLPEDKKPPPAQDARPGER